MSGPMRGEELIQEVSRIKADIASRRIAYLESLSKPSRKQREQLDRERATLALNS